MKKFSKKFLSIILSLLMVITILPAGMITAEAAVDTTYVSNRLNTVINEWNKKYWTTNGKPASSYKDSNYYNGWQCYGFAAYTFNRIFESGCIGAYNKSYTNGYKKGSYIPYPNGAREVAKTNSITQANVKNVLIQARPGDFVQWSYKNRDSQHSIIIISSTSNGINYFDCNGDGKCGVATRYISYSQLGTTGLNSRNYNYQLAGLSLYTSTKYEKLSPPKVTVPNTPSTPNVSVTDIAQGNSITITWNSVSNATGYKVAIRGAETKDIDVGNTTSYTYKLNNASTYNFHVLAYNSAGSSNWSGYRTCTAHSPVTVTFTDWDGTLLKTQTVNWGSSASTPAIPVRKGYTFAGWDGTYQNLKSNSTVKAQYKINQYTVNFLDKNQKIIKTEKVDFGSDATPPTDTNAPTGYSFVGWDSESYKNVYTDANNKTINVQGIYEWSNNDLPIVANITSAKRQSDGYYVYFDLTNYPNAITRGRAVVSLKTASGKLVDMSESSAFSIAKDATKTGMEVFIPSDKAATQVEVIVVDSYSSGVPISTAVMATIDQGLMWSDWSTEEPADTTDLEVESKVQYRYSDKETTTGNTTSLTGWTYDGTRSESVGNWSSWSWSSVSAYTNESSKREVQTQSAVKSYNYKTVWNYYRWAAQYSGGYSSAWQTSNHPNSYSYSFDSALGGAYTTSQGVTGYKWYYNGSNYCVLYACSQATSQVQTSANYATQYRYRDTKYTYNFYRWKDWSDWSDEEITATSNKQVETQTVYRYKSVSAATEDDSGKEYTISNKLSSDFAGKQITLYVYGYTGASDYTNEYIGQSTVAEDGSYSFTFKLREEPTIATGDFTVAIGIEGTTDLITIDTIEAPKPQYTVNFYDWDGTVIDTQLVTKGENATLPSNPTKEGYNFVGWDKTNTNITADTDIYADFEKQEFTVVFVDWANQVLKTEIFEYGDVLTAPDFSDIEGYTCEGWDEINAGNTIVTSNMIVTAKYDINTYTVNFYDFDGNVIDTQTVEYNSSAEAPSTVDESSDGKQFAGWFNPEEYENVSHDVNVYPAYYFEETTEEPVANYDSGEYDTKLNLTLSVDDSNAVIYYYLNDDETTEKIYTGSITVDKTCSITYYATSLGKNDSEKTTNYYCINSGEPSEWMLYSELPSEVIQNASEYLLENDTGYRYKNTVETSNGTEASNYEEEGWLFDSTKYSDWTDWQDEEISIDSSKIDFEVDTQEVADTTVTNYQYSHYKYVDGDGTTQYSPTEVSGFDCTLETITLESKLSIAGFTDDSISYYNYNSQQWFKQTKVNGTKIQYRSHYQIATYYQWTNWTTDAPTSNEKREYETNDVYRYTNKKYHIVTIHNENFENDIIILSEDNKTLDFHSIAEINGYTCEGFYMDSELTNKLDTSLPVTRELYLYVNYSPIPYTVTFQMQDGTELDTQTVLYGESATAPATDSVPGYVFAGWDKDFDAITEDTVVTGKYVKESEYAYITLNCDKLTMDKGNSSILSYSLTPSNLTNEEITWSSSDGGVATVDENGIVKAIGVGIATITATVTSSKEKATCLVTVGSSTSDNIVLSNNSTLNYDSLGYLRRIKFNSTVEDIMAQFQNAELSFVKIDGTTLDSTDNVGTGTKINLYKDGEIIDTNTVIVTADMTGDGIISNRDVVMFNKYQVSKITPDECQILAMDVNGDGYVNNKDAAMVARYLVGKETL